MRPNLQSLVASTVRSVRRDAFFAIAGAVAALVALALLLAWGVSGFERWPAPSPWPLTLEITTSVLAGAVVFWALRRLGGATQERQIAAAGEAALGLPEGSVRGVLELARDVPVGTSPALARSAQARLDSLVSDVDGHRFGGSVSAGVRRRRTQTWIVAVALVIAAVSLALVSPTRSRAGWAPLLHPVAHLSPPPMPLMHVEPGNVDVPRGSTLAVKIKAPLRETVLLEWRAAGAVRRSATVSISDGAGGGNIPSIDAPVRYWVTAPDGAVTDTFTVRPTDPLLVSDLDIEVVYPSYLGRPAEQFQNELPSLEIPEGTELRIHGRATRALGKATLAADSARAEVDLRIEGTGFEGRWVPRTSGFYEWRLQGANGVRAELVPPPFELVVIPDQPPEIEVTYPGVDTTLTADLIQTIAAEARDDHGLLDAVLVSWRTSSTGQKDPVVEQPVTLEGEADRAVIRGMLDVKDRHLLPGDTLSYFIRVTDNSPRRQSTVSQTYRLRLPSMEELRQQAGDQADDLQKQLDQITQTARDLEKQTRDLNRRAAADPQKRTDRTGSGSSQGNPGDKQMDFEKAEQTRSLVERQQQMIGQVDQMKERIQALERAMEQAGLRDPDLQKRLQEMRELYDKMLTPELRKKLEELKQNIDKMDPEQVQKSLEQLAKQQEEFRQQLERSLELMRRAAAEQEMNKLAQEAKELATQQQAVSDQMKQDGKTPEQKSDQQKDMSAKADSLNKALQELMKRLGQQGETAAAEKTGDAQKQAEQASDDMKKAAQQAGKQQGQQQAAQTGEKAAEKLNDAAKTLEDARKQMAEGWKKEVQDAMDKATNDALSLAKQQNDLLEKMQQAQAGKQQQQQGEKGGSQSLPKPPQMGNQQQQGQQSGQQQQQKGGQQQQSGGQQQGGQQQQGGKQGQQGQQGGQPGQQGQQQQQQGAQQGGQGTGGQSGNDTQSIKSEQSALKQGVEQLGQNLQEAGQRSAMVNRDVGAALGRANMSMEQALKALEQGGRMPTQEASQALDALNKLALELLKNSQQLQDAQAGTGLQQALEQLAELAKQQGGVNGQSSSLAPMNLAPQVMADQLQRLAKQQKEIAQKLDGMNNIGGRDDALGRLDELAKEANELAKDLAGGRLTPQTLARQERLFHRLLDAGRTLERDEYSEERKAERPGAMPPHIVKNLKPGLLEENTKYRVPSEAELRGYPPAVRRYIIEYYQRINQSAATAAGKGQ